jgi:hypothetical protein
VSDSGRLALCFCLLALAVFGGMYGPGVLTIFCVVVLALLGTEPLVALVYRLGRREARLIDYLVLAAIATLFALITLAIFPISTWWHSARR